MIYFEILKSLGSADPGYNSQMFPTVLPSGYFAHTRTHRFTIHKGSMNLNSPLSVGCGSDIPYIPHSRIHRP